MFRSITGFLFGCEETATYNSDSVISHDSKSVDFLDPNDWVIVEEDYYRSMHTEHHSSCAKENDFVWKESNADFETGDLSLVRSTSLANSFSGDQSDFDRLCGPFVDMREFDLQSDAALSDVSSQPEFLYNPSIEECWIVSPSPCFTGRDVPLEMLKSSSMEDLLIEHPSMSIYKLRGRRPLHNAMNESQSLLCDMDTNISACSSIKRNWESMENLQFLPPPEHESLIYKNPSVQSPYWTSDSESSSLDLSLSRSRSGVDQPLAVVNSEKQNLEIEQLMNESSDSLNSGHGNLRRKCINRMQIRTSHGSIEHNNKSLQQQTKKKQKYRRMCYSSFNSPNGKKKSS